MTTDTDNYNTPCLRTALKARSLVDDALALQVTVVDVGDRDGKMSRCVDTIEQVCIAAETRTLLQIGAASRMLARLR